MNAGKTISRILFAEIFDYRLYSLLTASVCFFEEFNNTKDAGGTIQFSCKIKIAKEFFFLNFSFCGFVACLKRQNNEILDFFLP